MKSFQYLCPETLNDARAMLVQSGAGAKPLLQLMIKKNIYGKKIIRIELFYLPAIDNCTKERSEMLPMLKRFRTISVEVRNLFSIGRRAEHELWKKIIY